MVRLTSEPIDYHGLTEAVRDPHCGAVALFLGTVRDLTGDQVTTHLDYEAYPAMAEKQMAAIEAEVRQRWTVGQVAMVHRLGRLGVGEVSVAVAVSGPPHRPAAFEACRHAIDALKELVPIWKKENAPDGTAAWVHPGDARMSHAALPKVYLARHGETEWTKTRQHTGRTDIPLTPDGEDDARLIGRRLAHLKFDHVFTSPLKRARKTCELAGFADRAVVDEDLLEWNYGAFEGLKTAEIRQRDPKWDLFRDGAPNGETVGQIAERTDRAVNRVKALTGNVLIFAHGHYLRVFAARWCKAEVSFARSLLLGTSSISVLSFDHDRLDEPAIMLWNDDRHLSGEGCLLPLPGK